VIPVVFHFFFCIYTFYSSESTECIGLLSKRAHGKGH
jgi:hypothetical protein